MFVPAFGLLALGAILRRSLLPDPVIWAGIERLVFWVLMPCLLAGAIAQVDLAALPIGRMATAIWLALGCGAVASLALARVFEVGHATMTSVLQGGIRFNNLMGFVVVGTLFGPPGAALGAVATGLIVPFVQIAAAIAFATAPRAAGRVGIPHMLFRAFLNPLLLGCLAGFVLAALGGLPHGVAPLVRSLGQAAVALGLLAVGAALTLAALRGRMALQAATAAIKLLLVPLLTWLIGRALDLDPVSLAAAVLFMALPTATTSYIMARALGGDAAFMAAVTTTEHVASSLTLSIWILLLAGR